MNAPRKRYKTIHIRYPTPSREGISLIVAQLEDDLGRWMVPTITVSHPIQQIIESGRFARDLAEALFKANYWFERWMLDVVDQE